MRLAQSRQLCVQGFLHVWLLPLGIGAIWRTCCCLIGLCHCRLCSSLHSSIVKLSFCWCSSPAGRGLSKLLVGELRLQLVIELRDMRLGSVVFDPLKSGPPAEAKQGHETVLEHLAPIEAAGDEAGQQCCGTEQASAHQYSYKQGCSHKNNIWLLSARDWLALPESGCALHPCQPASPCRPCT